MKLVWMILSGFCIVGAAALIFLGRLDAAFVVAAIGIVAWFLNYRIQMKQVIAAADFDKRDQADNDGEDDGYGGP